MFPIDFSEKFQANLREDLEIGLLAKFLLPDMAKDSNNRVTHLF